MQKMLEWKTVDLDGHPIATSVTAAETKCLQELAKRRNVLEIGSGYGYSAIAMAKTAKHVTAIDPHAGELPGSYEQMVANLDLHGVSDKVTIVREYSQDYLPRLIEERRRYGLIFVDGCHFSPHVDNDLELSLKLLSKNGYLACHDLYSDEWGTEGCDFPDIARALDKLGKPLKIVDTLWVMQCLSQS